MLGTPARRVHLGKKQDIHITSVRQLRQRITQRNKTMANGNLKLDPQNIRKHSDRNKRAIRKSLETVGAGRSILVGADDTILAGNGVFEQAQEIGLPVRVIESDGQELIAVKRVDLSGARARQAAALDNIVADTSAYEYDAERLAELVKDDEIIAAFANEDARIKIMLQQQPENVNFKEYDESIADDVKYAECPKCGHKFPL